MRHNQAMVAATYGQCLLIVIYFVFIYDAYTRKEITSVIIANMSHRHVNYFEQHWSIPAISPAPFESITSQQDMF